MQHACKTCGDVKPEAAFSSRQLKRAKTNDGGSCTACINTGDSGRRANPSPEELWRRFELAESDGALDGGAHRKGRLKLRAARAGADAVAAAKRAYQNLLLTYDIGKARP